MRSLPKLFILTFATYQRDHLGTFGRYHDNWYDNQTNDDQNRYRSLAKTVSIANCRKDCHNEMDHVQ